MGSFIAGNGGATNVINGTVFSGVVTFGASVIASQIGNGVTFARADAGAYTVTFPQAYFALVGFSFGWQTTTGASQPFLRVLATTDLPVGGTITCETSPEAGTNADPTSGYKLFYSFTVTSSDLNKSR